MLSSGNTIFSAFSFPIFSVRFINILVSEKQSCLLYATLTMRPGNCYLDLSFSSQMNFPNEREKVFQMKFYCELLKNPITY